MWWLKSSYDIRADCEIFSTMDARASSVVGGSTSGGTEMIASAVIAATENMRNA